MMENADRIWYDDSATVAKFLLGGIGTGNVSVGSRGQLCDWEIFGGPNKGNNLSNTFFALRWQAEGQTPQVRILESRIKPPYESSHGYHSWDGAGIPRFAKARLAGEVSQATVQLRDEALPLEVDMAAFTPFVPLDADDSGIPAAVIRYTVRNVGNAALAASVAGSMANPVGFTGHGLFAAQTTDGEPVNTYREEPGAKGIFMTNPSLAAGHLANGSMALVTTTGENVTAKPYWAKSSNWDGAHDFWQDFAEDGKLQETNATKDNVIQPYDSARLRVCALCTDFSLAPGEEKEIEFILSWYFPNRPVRWQGHIFDNADDGRLTKNYYATKFADARDVGSYLRKNLARLEKDSAAFRSALYQTTLPAEMLDAMAANITVLRSTTCFRIEDGTFLGWEGTFDHRGCCEGNCSHVWNYQQTLAFLFPALERDMRKTNFLGETCEDGEMAYRANTMFGYERFLKIPPASDGQMGTIVQLYRDWKLCGDDAFLREMWPNAVKALEYAFTKWDTDGDFVFDGEQHNTYDIEFFGKTSMTNSIFYAALKAGEEMAAHLGENERAARYRHAREAGAAKMDKELFNGEFYIQKLDEGDDHPYQYGMGCLSDQVLGQQLAHMAGLGDILPKGHVKSALESIMRYNYREDMFDHLNVQRTYALNDDAGLILCTWPNGGKPYIPFIYSDEVWTGIEYQVAAHMVHEGMFDDALTIVKAVRARYDGVKRNPWNEVECGNHYVRSMASWGLLLAASGYGFDLGRGEVSFAPKVPGGADGEFTCFFSTAKCWGVYRQKKNSGTGQLERGIEILYGDGSGLRLA